MERSSKKSNRNANKKGRNYKKDVDESKNDPDNDEQARQQYRESVVKYSVINCSPIHFS